MSNEKIQEIELEIKILKNEIEKNESILEKINDNNGHYDDSPVDVIIRNDRAKKLLLEKERELLLLYKNSEKGYEEIEFEKTVDELIKTSGGVNIRAKASSNSNILTVTRKKYSKAVADAEKKNENSRMFLAKKKNKI